MTRKHYLAMADSLRFEHPARHSDAGSRSVSYVAAVGQWTRDVRAIADVFAQDNGRFDRQRFYAACGLDSDR